MAVVATHRLSIYTKDVRESYTVKLLYNSNLKFHIDIPNELVEVTKHTKNRDEYSIHGVTRTHGRDIIKYVVTGETESACLVNAKKCFEYLVAQSIVQRDVIIVFYNPKDVCNYNDHKYNKEHPQIGMQFGLTYAVETSLGDAKIYSIYPEGGHFEGGQRHNRKEITLWNRSSTIIPDTPENRKTLESVYEGFVLLNEKMKSFTESSEKLLEFIDSKVKLLN